MAARVAKLREELERHSYLYYVLDAPQIGDSDYDKLFRELQDLEEAHPELRSPNSPTARVGGPPVSGFVPHRHLVPMLSLDNSFSEEELRAFDERVRKGAGVERVDYFAEVKFDGASMSLTYGGRRVGVRLHTRRLHNRGRRHSKHEIGFTRGPS